MYPGGCSSRVCALYIRSAPPQPTMLNPYFFCHGPEKSHCITEITMADPLLDTYRIFSLGICGYSRCGT